MAQAKSLIEPGLQGWRMAGPGGFREVESGTIESYGGSGIFWYAPQRYADFVLTAEWCVQRLEDNSGIFLRIPALDDNPRPAVEQGYEVQIDERGVRPEDGAKDVPDRLSGAIYKLAPATARPSRPIGEWNRFRIEARGDEIIVDLNETRVSHLLGGCRNRDGHIGLQNHHDGSAVQFRKLEIVPV